MKLLFDENLSSKLPDQLGDLYPDSTHVREVGLRGQPDALIWSFAAANDFVLVSKDTDFYQRSVVSGSPPKIVWLRIGNAGTGATASLLRDQYVTIRRFIEDFGSSILVLPTTLQP